MKTTFWIGKACLLTMLMIGAPHPTEAGCVAGAGGSSHNVAVPCAEGGGPPPRNDNNTTTGTYVPSRPSQGLLQTAADRINRLLNMQPYGLGPEPTLSGVHDFHSLARAADDTLFAAHAKYNYQQARWWSAKDDLKNWRMVTRQWADVRSQLRNDLTRHRDARSNTHGTATAADGRAGEIRPMVEKAEAQTKNLERVSAEARSRFYRAAVKLGEDLPPPSSFRRPPRPGTTMYGPGHASGSSERKEIRFAEPARLAKPEPVRLAAAAVPAFTATRANASSISLRFDEAGSLLEQARLANSHANVVEEDVAAERRRADAIGRDIFDIRSEISSLRIGMSNDNHLLNSARRERRELRAKIDQLDRILPVKAVEAAAWGELESRIIDLVEERSGLLGVLSGVNDVRNVMQEAADLADGVLAVAADAPEAFVYDADRIPELQRRLDSLVDKFALNFYATASGLPGWMVPLVERYTERRPWQ